MAYQDLRQTPVFQQALRTGKMIDRCPGSYAQGREAHLRDSYFLRDASYRLDHLMRRALDPFYFPDFPSRMFCSAIMAFMEVIDEALPRLNLTEPETAKAFIGERLDLCREIISRANTTLDEGGYPRFTSNDFRDFVTQTGLQIEDIVFDNPLYIMAQNGAPYYRTQREFMLMQEYGFYWD